MREQIYFDIVDTLDNRTVMLSDIVNVSMTDQSKSALIAKLDSKPDFRRAWSNNISGRYYKDLWEKLDPDAPIPRNETSRYYGEPSAGKSWVSLWFAYLQKEFFNFSYENLFSQMDAGKWLVTKAYEANKRGFMVTRALMNIDEDKKMFGTGSVQEETFFDGFLEFLRQAQINVHVCNPNDISNIDTQFECIGYDGEGYAKSIIYQVIDRRTREYKPLGYVLTKAPPKNYVDAYKLQKEDFLKNFVGNRSGRLAKNETMLELVWNDMPKKNKEMIRSAILLNNYSDIKHLIQRELSIFNLPQQYTNDLITAFKFKYFEPEIEQVYERQKQQMIHKAIKAGIMKPETLQQDTAEELGLETKKKTELDAIKLLENAGKKKPKIQYKRK